MKRRVLRTLSVIAVMVAMLAVISCGSKQVNVGDKSVINAADTAGFTQFKAWKAQQEEKDAVAPIHKPVKSTAIHGSKRRAATTQTGSLSTSNEYPAKAKPKGWSKAAKGAVIGAGGGAILGAVIIKNNRALGAAIGGVAGGAVGYGVGRHMDKKDGRY
jgi:hypothetical protein